VYSKLLASQGQYLSKELIINPSKIARKLDHLTNGQKASGQIKYQG